MSKRARRARRKRHKAINTAGVDATATPRLDQARRWRDEIHAQRQALTQHGDEQHGEHAPGLEQPSATTNQPAAIIPPPPWKAFQ